MKGIRRAIGTRQHGKDPLLTADICRIVDHCPDSLLGTRDRALILVGFAGAFGRSELSAIEVADVSFNPDAIVIDLRRSKTDQEGAGRKVGIPFGSDELTCAVRALRHWLLEAGILLDPCSGPSTVMAVSGRVVCTRIRSARSSRGQGSALT